jgi:hypothetical protein
MWKCTFKLSALPHRWINVTAPVCAVFRVRPPPGGGHRSSTAGRMPISGIEEQQNDAPPRPLEMRWHHPYINTTEGTGYWQAE